MTAEAGRRGFHQQQRLYSVAQACVACASVVDDTGMPVF
jgi:hypothetical protein